MLQKVLNFIFGSKYERDLKRLTPIVQEINSHESKISQMSNDELGNQTKVFRDRLANGESLDQILPELTMFVNCY